MLNSFLTNPFPTLLSFSLLSPFILRVVLGVMFVKIGLHISSYKEPRPYSKIFKGKNLKTLSKAFGLLQLLTGVLLILGLCTQIASIVAIFFAGFSLVATRKGLMSVQKPPLYFLIIAVALSLLFSGAGAFALDLPL